MSNTILGKIEAAEREAESIRVQANREARDIVKAVEEADAAQARQAAKNQAEQAQRRLEAARVLIGDEIKALEVRRGAERETLRKIASARVSQAGQLIFERVVLDGHR
ncbi:MAG TPA: hypothetical protein IAA74_09675 [Candidatus Excrementavichristensenella intestinipullorum]|nr:hypothetical protein [Candidatus Excrementavichristensenella intestinipullorum]